MIRFIGMGLLGRRCAASPFIGEGRTLGGDVFNSYRPESGSETDCGSDPMLEHLSISWGVVRDVQGGYFLDPAAGRGELSGGRIADCGAFCGLFCGLSVIGPLDHWMRAACVASTDRRRQQPIDFERN
jgi:hypothetical protein